MPEIIVLTRDQYFSDLQAIATRAADHALNQFLARQQRPAAVKRVDAARLLSKSKATINKMIEQGRINTTADGSAIPYSEIERYLNEK
jgi:hypothetical protein